MLTSIAGVFLGMAMFRGGRPNLPGTVLGVILLRVLENGLNFTDINDYLQSAITGLVIVIAVLPPADREVARVAARRAPRQTVIRPRRDRTRVAAARTPVRTEVERADLAAASVTPLLVRGHRLSVMRGRIVERPASGGGQCRRASGGPAIPPGHHGHARDATLRSHRAARRDPRPTAHVRSHTR